MTTPSNILLIGFFGFLSLLLLAFGVSCLATYFSNSSYFSDTAKSFLWLGLYSCAIGIITLGALIIPKPLLGMPDRLIFAGKVVNKATGKWPDDRLVLLFLEGKEIARSITARGEFPQSNQGVHDGLFTIEINNDYRLTVDTLNSTQDQGIVFDKGSKGSWAEGYTFAYQWINYLAEGEIQNIPVPSKNIKYTLKVIEGDVSELPAQLLVPGSTMLLDNNSILVATSSETTTAQIGDSNTEVKNIVGDEGLQVVDLSKFVVPINNCGGSSLFSQKYVQSQTMIHEYRAETTAGIKFDFPVGIWLAIVPELQTKYGYEQGQIETKTVEYEMAVEPKTRVTYTITWQEVWQTGFAEILSGNDTILVPYRAKSYLVYKVDSEPLGC